MENSLTMWMKQTAQDDYWSGDGKWLKQLAATGSDEEWEEYIQFWIGEHIHSMGAPFLKKAIAQSIDRDAVKESVKAFLLLQSLLQH